MVDKNLVGGQFIRLRVVFYGDDDFRSVVKMFGIVVKCVNYCYGYFSQYVRYVLSWDL